MSDETRENRDRANSNEIAELGKYFSPSGSLVDKLPNPKDVKDFSEAFTKNKDGTYNCYKMIQGNWVVMGTNLAKV